MKWILLLIQKVKDGSIEKYLPLLDRFSMLYLTDPTTNKKSVTLTLFVIGFAVCTFKLLMSGMMVHTIKFSEFTGGDYAAGIAGVGLIYTMRRKAPDDKEEAV